MYLNFNNSFKEKVKIYSLKYSRMQNKLQPFVELGEKITPDLSNQHTQDKYEKMTDYKLIKRRNQQAFQIQMVYCAKKTSNK